jgi:hypothetical protein
MFIRSGSMDVLQPNITSHTPRSLRVPGVMSAGFRATILVTENRCERLSDQRASLSSCRALRPQPEVEWQALRAAARRA